VTPPTGRRPPKERYATPERQDAFLAALTERLVALPGVASVSTSFTLPAQFTTPFANQFAIVGDPPPDASHIPAAYSNWVSVGYFRTVGIKLLHGRDLLESDSRTARHVAIVDELFARRFFAGKDPVGRQIAFNSGLTPDTADIVGVVGHVKQFGLLAADEPMYYLPFTQNNARVVGIAAVVVRAVADPTHLTGTLREAIAGVDPTVAIEHVETLTERLVQTVGTTRFESVLAVLFAGVALVLGIVGIYSVLAYIVRQRQRDIAIRTALGVSRARVMNQVLQRAALLTSVGIASGSLAAWLLTRILASLFLGVNPHDPTMFLGAAGVLAVAAFAAAAVPAFRTTRVSPLAVLSST